MPSHSDYMRLALRLARRGYGTTSPNPMVGAVLVKGGRIIGRGWHRRAGGPHAEIEALRNAQMRGHQVKGATLYVTLEPCPMCAGAAVLTRLLWALLRMEQTPQPAGPVAVAVLAAAWAAAWAAASRRFFLKT